MVIDGMVNSKLKSIPQYPGYYADCEGNIYSFRSGMKRLLKQRIHRGYYHVFVRDSGSPVCVHKEPVHKLVLSAFVGERPDNMVCRHLNGDALDNNIDNLCWGTTKENVQDSIKHGTAVCLRHGENAVASKISLADVCEIRWLYLNGYKQKELSTRFNISQHHVSDIVHGKTWVKDLGLGG